MNLPHSITQLYCLLLLLLPSVLPAQAAGQIDTIAGSGEKQLNRFQGPADQVNLGQTFGVEVGPQGALYITEVENHRVWKLDPETQTLLTVAGNGKKGYSGDGGPATKASLNEPYEVRFDSQGNLYFVEMRGAVIRKVDAQSGIITTIAGTGKTGFAGDGKPATQAQFDKPHSIAFDEHDNLYIADIGNHRIRRIDAKTGLIQTIAGTGEKKLPVSGKPAKGQAIQGPRALYVADGNLWIALREGNSIWKLNLQTGRLDHIAGTGKKGYRDGPAKQALFNGPKGIALGPDKAVYVVDTENQTIRRVDLQTERVSTVAGVGPQGRGFHGDGGPATKAHMDRPHGIAVDSQGNLYIGDTNNHRVRRVRPAGD